MTPCTESGMRSSASRRVATQPPFSRSSAPSSMSICSISSRKKGLPSALDRSGRRTPSGTRASPSRFEASCSDSSAESGVSESVVAFCFPAPHDACPARNSGTGGADEQHARVRHPLGEVLDEIEQGGGGPVDVLDHDHGQPSPAERRDVALPAVGEELADSLAVHGRQGRLFAREADRPRDRVEDLGRALLDDCVDGDTELPERHVDGVGVEDLGVRLRRLGERPVRDPFPVGQAAPLEHPRARETGQELADEPRLPHACRAEERDELRHLLALAPSGDDLEQRKLFFAPDQRR